MIIAEIVRRNRRGHGQAAGALMNLASNNGENQRAIIKAGALPLLVSMLGGNSGAKNSGAKSGASRRAREYVAGALMNLMLKQPDAQARPASPSSRDGKTTLSSGDGRDLVSLCSVVGVGTD